MKPRDTLTRLRLALAAYYRLTPLHRSATEKKRAEDRIWNLCRVEAHAKAGLPHPFIPGSAK